MKITELVHSPEECINCGADIPPGEGFCSKKCKEEFDAYCILMDEKDED